MVEQLEVYVLDFRAGVVCVDCCWAGRDCLYICVSPGNDVGKGAWLGTGALEDACDWSEEHSRESYFDTGEARLKDIFIDAIITDRVNDYPGNS